MWQFLATAVPAVIAAIVSLVTLFSNKKSKVSEKLAELTKKQNDMENKYDYNQACQARSRILMFNNEIMRGLPHTKDYFDDIIENSIDVYERYYNDPNHKNLKNGIARAAIKNIYRVYDEMIHNNSFLQYPKEGD
jgi:hypothetical protein